MKGIFFSKFTIKLRSPSFLPPCPFLPWPNACLFISLRRSYSKGRDLPSLFASIDHLEHQANAHPQNPEIQAQLYHALLKSNTLDLETLLRRFENLKYARNPTCWKYYIEALAQSGKAHLIYEKISTHFNESSLVYPSTRGRPPPPPPPFQKEEKHLSSSSLGMVGGSNSPDHPLYVTLQSSSSRQEPPHWFWGMAKHLSWAFFILTGLALFLDASGLPFHKPSTPMSLLAQVPTTNFQDAAGVDEAKDELKEIVDFLKHPETFTKLGGTLPKGILLTGPPGTGKTLLARAVAGEAGVPFFFMSGSEFDELYVGMGAKRVRDLFASAKQHSPSIIFIDELDAIGGKRHPRDHHSMRQTLNQLLVDLDGFTQHPGIIFMGATNFPELLDPALVRPGRFDKHIHIQLPDVRGRMQVIHVHLKKIQVDPHLDVAALARGTPGFSGAELANLVNQAAIQASRLNSPYVCMSHFEYAKDKLLMGSERRLIQSESTRTLTAYHEAGHTLMAYYTPHAMPIHKATILPRGQALGMTVQLPELDHFNYTKSDFLAMMDVALGGRAAEALFMGTEEAVTTGAHHDLEKVMQVAKQFLASGLHKLPFFFNEKDYPNLSDTMKCKLEMEIQSLIEASYTRTKQLLNEKKKELGLLAHALLEYETLDAKDIETVLKGGKLK